MCGLELTYDNLANILISSYAFIQAYYFDGSIRSFKGCNEAWLQKNFHLYGHLNQSGLILKEPSYIYKTHLIFYFSKP